MVTQWRERGKYIDIDSEKGKAYIVINVVLDNIFFRAASQNRIYPFIHNLSNAG
jgi:hypothetical protein